MEYPTRSVSFLIPMVMTACLVLSTASAFAYGGGGDGGDATGTSLTGDSTSENKTPPDGFDPSSDPGMGGIVSDFGTGEMDTSSQGTSDDQRNLEEKINEEAGRREIEVQQRQEEEERNRPPTRMEVSNQAQEYLSNLPPEVRQQLTQRYTSAEILTIKQFGQMTDAIRNTKDPELLHILQQGLTNAQNNFVKNHNVRLAQRQAQLQRTREDAEFVAKFIVGVGVNVATAGAGKVGIAVNIAYNTAVGGARGGGTAAVATALTSKIPGGNIAANAVRDAITQEAVNQAIEPDKAH
ncbi:MAG: hypothetical protein JJV98_07885 [Desulfosarcina sp.]|nr:hypothetical protein [Desulfobacterales bacterium]